MSNPSESNQTKEIGTHKSNIGPKNTSNVSVNHQNQSNDDLVNLDNESGIPRGKPEELHNNSNKGIGLEHNKPKYKKARKKYFQGHYLL